MMGIIVSQLRNWSYVFIGCVGINLVLLISILIETVKQIQIMEYLRRQMKQNQRDETGMQTSTIMKKRIELSIFENQINPHFLYNTLENIRGEALEQGQQEIADMTERLSCFFRYCISSRGLLVKLSEELHNVEDYVFIQKYRFGDRIEFQTDIKQEQGLEYYIPKLTLQPIVENAIAHGIEKTGRKGIIRIVVCLTESRLYICVEDNGAGIRLEELARINERLVNGQVQVSVSGKRHNGIAVQNINSRIRLCFGEEYGLHYRSIEGKGTQVEIVLPLIDEYSRMELEQKYNNIA